MQALNQFFLIYFTCLTPKLRQTIEVYLRINSIKSSNTITAK